MTIVDEYTMRSAKDGTHDRAAMLRDHWQTWVTEDILETLANAGITQWPWTSSRRSRMSGRSRAGSRFCWTCTRLLARRMASITRAAAETSPCLRATTCRSGCR